MADDPLADLLARNAARRAAKKGGSSPAVAPSGPADAFDRPPMSASSSSDKEVTQLKRQVETLSTELTRLRAVEAGACANTSSGLTAAERKASGVVEVDMDEVQLEGDKVAQGGFSVLYRGIWRHTDIAVKKPVDPRAAMDAGLKQEFQHEVNMLSELRHPNIVLLLGASLRPPKLCMIFEWCDGGSLYDRLHHTSREFSRPAQKRISVAVATALAFLHSCCPQVIHRDVKSHNVLVDETCSTAKLCDFGLAIRVADAGIAREGQGTLMYMAPELFRGEAYSLQSDVYAFGMTFYEMATREIAFNGYDVDAVRSKVKAGDRPDIPLSTPRPMTQIMSQCWQQEPSRRPTMTAVLEQLKSL